MLLFVAKQGFYDSMWPLGISRYHYSMTKKEPAVAIVFFDLDHTLIRGSTGTASVKYYRRKGLLTRKDILFALWFSLLHFLDLARIEKMMKKALVPFLGRPVAEINQELEAVFNTYIQREFFSEALVLVEWHRQRGDKIVIISASSVHAVQPIAAYLNLPFIASAAEVVDDKLTDDLILPVPYGAGKVFHAQKYIQEHGGDIASAWFYSDSNSDRFLLEKVGHPICVNPDWRLARTARKKGWEIVRFRETLGQTI